jgi:MFS family permease
MKSKRTLVASAAGPDDSSAAADPLDRTRCSATETLAALAALPTSASPAALRRNLWLLNTFCFLQGLIFLNPVFVLYLKSHLQDSATSVSWILALQSITIFLTELPGGMLADLVGRKYCLMASVLTRICGLSLLMLLHTFMPSLSPLLRFLGFTCATLCEGVTQALGAGTDIALLHDSLAGLGHASEFHSRLATRSMMWPLAACIASLVGGAMAERYGTASCTLATLLSTLLALPVTFSLTEVYPRVYDLKRMWRKRGERRRSDAMEREAKSTPASPSANSSTSIRAASDSSLQSHRAVSISPPLSLAISGGERNLLLIPPCPSPLSTIRLAQEIPSLARFSAIFRAHLMLCWRTLRKSAELQSFIVLSTLLYCTSEPLHRLRSLYFTAHSLPPTLFGAIGAGMFGWSSIGSGCSISMTKRWGRRSILLLCASLPPLLTSTSTFLTGLPSALVLLPISFLWGVRTPVLAQMLHEEISMEEKVGEEEENHQEETAAAVTTNNPDPSSETRCSLEASASTSSTARTRSDKAKGQRATVASVQSLANKLALALCLAFLAGPVTDEYGIDTTMRLFAALAVLPVGWAVLHLGRKQRQEDRRKKE